LVGPAIDEAAEMEHEPEGAFIVLCPSASACLGADRRALPLLYDYRVPCKKGAAKMHVVNPTFYTLDVTKYVRSILSTFTESGSVRRKRDNTEAFLFAAAQDPIGIERRTALISQAKRMVENATADAIARVHEIAKSRVTDQQTVRKSSD
jgi:hypothetical protein